ncbi:MAG: divalent-cation tolerance protein CutA [Xanthomonadales bacterium]|jgi:periplasmic divalent cation tolerance protein|nr:divalent-cation tolerance protein CutA [Xanthomonadales bacterium]
MSQILVVLCTCPDENVARELARGLVEQHLAACVNILPEIRSIYRWQGAVSEDGESLMVIKTSLLTWGQLENWLNRNHPYDLPELIALPVDKGLPAYLEWVVQESEP